MIGMPVRLRLQRGRSVPLQFNSVTPPIPEPAARAALHCHPATPSPNVAAIEVLFNWRAGACLELSYLLAGRVQAVAVPAARDPQFADRLWEHTCFEAFIADPDGGYCELNLSPSTQWAIYRFAGYRTGMMPVEVTRRPRITVHTGADRLRIDALVDLGECARWHPGDGLRMALTCVIEEMDGSMSYWALAHPCGIPDFHHPDGFALQLAPPQPQPKGPQ
jgi:hypothetical protein